MAIGGTVLAVLLLTIGIWQHHKWLPPLQNAIARASGASVEHIMITGAYYTDKQTLANTLQLNKGDDLMSFQPAAARKRLEALPWVRLAAVERKLPHTVRIEIYEHKPVARVSTSEQDWVINKDGAFITRASAKFNHLPQLTGPGAAAQAASLFLLLQDHPKLLHALKTATFVEERRWDLHFRSGVRVKLPEADAPRALVWLNKLDEKRHVLTLTAGTIDLRLPDRIVMNIPPTALTTPVITQDTEKKETE